MEKEMSKVDELIGKVAESMIDDIAKGRRAADGVFSEGMCALAELIKARALAEANYR